MSPQYKPHNSVFFLNINLTTLRLHNENVIKNSWECKTKIVGQILKQAGDSSRQLDVSRHNKNASNNEMQNSLSDFSILQNGKYAL